MELNELSFKMPTMFHRIDSIKKQKNSLSQFIVQR